MPEFLRSRLFKSVAIVAAIVGLYAWFGFRVAPGIVRSQAIKYVHQTYGKLSDPFGMTRNTSRDVCVWGPGVTLSPPTAKFAVATYSEGPCWTTAGTT